MFDSSLGDQIEQGTKIKRGLREKQHEISDCLSWISQKVESDDEQGEQSAQGWRYASFSTLIVFAFLILLGRLFDLQIIQGRENLVKSEGNRVVLQTVPAPRGVIYEAHGEVLARNRPGEKEGEIIREYPQGEYFSHILGYVGEISSAELKNPAFATYNQGDTLGRAGLEAQYEKVLRGTPGQNLAEENSSGEILRTLSKKEPQPGQNLYLSLDAFLQQKAGEILTAALQKHSATAAVFVAQNVKDGKILSLVSLPAYNNNLFARGDADLSKLLSDGGTALFNRAISGEYPPGSTVKPVVGVAALQEKLIAPATKISDEPQIIRIGQFEFPDWTIAWGAAAHGLLDIAHAIAESCDIFFYKIGGGYPPECRRSEVGGQKSEVGCQVDGLGVEKLKIYFKLFGLGEPTGIDLPGEAAGLVPDPIWKESQKNEAWYLGDTYHISIGQGFMLTTPLQINNLITTIASGGKLLQPTLLDQQGRTYGTYKTYRENFVDPEYIKIIQQGMRLAVSDGIVYPLRTAKIAVAAKTGTAEFGVKNAKGEYQTHAWVTGFAPFDDPQISFTVLLEAGGKSSNAAEVAKEILDWYFSK